MTVVLQFKSQYVYVCVCIHAANLAKPLLGERIGKRDFLCGAVMTASLEIIFT